MKTRLVVMNEHRIVQTEHDGEWVNEKIQRAGKNIKAGIYDLYLSQELALDGECKGVIIHADNDYVYQLDGKKIIKYSVTCFDKKITVGSKPTVIRQKSGEYKIN